MQVVGIDEVGRGALAGPVVVGAVLLSDDFSVPDILGKPLRDSKQHKHRDHSVVAQFVMVQCEYGLGEASVAEIEKLGLSGALRLAADRALDSLLKPGVRVVADAGLFHGQEMLYPAERFVGGDGTIAQITLASHLAKWHRDGAMVELASEFPTYGWERNVGYGTKEHRNAILEHGKTIHHRELFLRKLLRAYPNR